MAMQIEFIRKLPSPQELMEQFPIDDRIRSIKAQLHAAFCTLISFHSDLVKKQRTSAASKRSATRRSAAS